MKNSIKILWLIIDVILTMAVFVVSIVIPSSTTLVFSLLISWLVLNFILSFVFKSTLLKFFRSSFFKNVTAHLIEVFIVLCILGLVNYWGVKLNRFHDFSTQKLSSLSEQSKQVSHMVNDPMHITLYAKRMDWEKYLTLLRLYEWENSKISVEAVDIETEPAKVAALGIDANGTVILEFKKKSLRGVALDERTLTNLILKSVREEAMTLYYTVGHEELNPKKIEPEGLTFLTENLRYSSYQVVPLDLTLTDKVPKDASLVMILGPKNDLLETEWEKIEDYLDHGGAVLLTLAPMFERKVHDYMLNSIKERFGIEYVNSLVIDRLASLHGKDSSTPVVNNYSSHHPITQDFSSRTIFPHSASFKIHPHEGVIVETLAQTTPFPASWGETNFKDLKVGKAEFNEKSDMKGPLPLLVSVEEDKTLSRLVIASSSSFYANAYQGQSGNFNLMLNAIAWLTNDEGVIALNRPELTGEKIIMSEEQIRLIFIVSILMTPILMITSALWLFFYRRKA